MPTQVLDAPLPIQLLGNTPERAAEGGMTVRAWYPPGGLIPAFKPYPSLAVED